MSLDAIKQTIGSAIDSYIDFTMTAAYFPIHLALMTYEGASQQTGPEMAQAIVFTHIGIVAFNQIAVIAGQFINGIPEHNAAPRPNFVAQVTHNELHQADRSRG